MICVYAETNCTRICNVKNKFTKSDIEAILGVKKTRLQEWIKSGFIEPHRPARGRGLRTFFYGESDGN